MTVEILSMSLTIIALEQCLAYPKHLNIIERIHVVNVKN